jgi:biopolymer transport protein ExbD
VKLALKTRKSRIELVPLLDMIFLVLVAFVYTFLSMSIQKGIPVRLPFAQSSVEDKSDYAVVTVTKENTVFVNKTAYPMDAVSFELERRKILDPSIQVFLNADKDVVYDTVVAVLDAIRRAGIEKVSLETSDRHE